MASQVLGPLDNRGQSQRSIPEGGAHMDISLIFKRFRQFYKHLDFNDPQYLEDEYNPVNETIEIDNPEDLAHFTSTPIQDNMYSIKGRQFSYFGHYNLILFKITDEYAAIYESLNQSSLDDLSEPITNIVNGKGIFASFNSDTLLINVVVD